MTGTHSLSITALCCAAWGFFPAAAQIATPRSQRVGVVVLRSPIGYLGVGAVAVDSEMAKSLGWKEERGVEITEVVEGSPAARAGLKEQDILFEYDGQRIEGTAQFQQMVRETRANRTVRVGVFRNGSGRAMLVQVGQRAPDVSSFSSSFPLEAPPIPAVPAPPDAPELVMPDIPIGLLSWQSSTLGYLSEPVEGQLAEYFGVKAGVLIRSVAKGSPAEKAGLRAGDIIVKVDSSAVRSPREITAIVHRRRDRKSVSLTVVRSRKEILLELLAMSLHRKATCLPPV